MAALFFYVGLVQRPQFLTLLFLQNRLYGIKKSLCRIYSILQRPLKIHNLSWLIIKKLIVLPCRDGLTVSIDLYVLDTFQKLSRFADLITTVLFENKLLDCRPEAFFMLSVNYCIFNLRFSQVFYFKNKKTAIRINPMTALKKWQKISSLSIIRF